MEKLDFKILQEKYLFTLKDIILLMVILYQYQFIKIKDNSKDIEWKYKNRCDMNII
jgi:hypothetical protein